ncbi:uncharacterized protein SAPINGB_P002473 [Magnusiomyces paraingens]|uniref:Uncharacterized protein n=1 Tax=Magnusiomyces paraingens TaxID=2606893 RepID=A0A5E8BJV4_9ASCO|nr:uncharacterized protein SAPINGB_P002473 [Saprochaete ingens]VVT49847.1 unnamed protein product [Saprochaete ingens]
MASGRLDTLSAINIKLPILRNDIKVLESSKPGLCFTAPDVENVRALISDRDWADLKDCPAFIRFPNVGVALLDPGKKLKGTHGHLRKPTTEKISASGSMRPIRNLLPLMAIMYTKLCSSRRVAKHLAPNGC